MPDEAINSEALPLTNCSAFWWIMGTVVIEKGYACLARKHRFFRYVQAWSWGRWNGIREEYSQIPKSFEQNNPEQDNNQNQNETEENEH
jgi:hypothetical protein